MSWFLVVVLAAVGALAGAGAGGVLRVVLARPPRGVGLAPAAVAFPLAAIGAVLAVGGLVGAPPHRWLPVLGVLAVLTVGGVGTDLAARRLPDRLTVPALVAVLGAAVPLGADRLLAGVAVGGLLVVLFGAVRLLAPAALGGGDVKVSAALGAAVGALTADGSATAGIGVPVGSSAVVAVGLGLPVVASTLLLVGAAVRRRRRLPYGPALFAAAWIELVIVT